MKSSKDDDDSDMYNAVAADADTDDESKDLTVKK